MVLRSAALKGDPGAAYEIGLRYAEGRGVPVNFDEAAKWYDRAAKADIVPAIFRLGTLYEKGLGVKKDVDTASRYYRQAAERGNAKAMHNLAVLEADGGGKTPNYKSASDWFRKAAERGVADSQFNLGILYARGIGVEQNLAESFNGSVLPPPRAMRIPAASGTTSHGGSTPSRWPRRSWRSRPSRRSNSRPTPSTSRLLPAGGTRHLHRNAPSNRQNPPHPRPPHRQKPQRWSIHHKPSPRSDIAR